MAEELNNFENFEREKKIRFQPRHFLMTAQMALGLVAHKYTKLGKTIENLKLSLGLSYITIPLCY